MHSGPAKDSLKLLQSRLHDVETCLLRVLSTISDGNLSKALEKPAADFGVSEDLGLQYPMDTTSAVRSWQRVRTTDITKQGDKFDCTLDSANGDGASPDYNVDAAGAAEYIESTWQPESAPFEQDHATSHQTSYRLLPSGLGTDEVAQGDEARLSHSSNPQSTHLGIAATHGMSTEKHDTTQQASSSTVRQGLSVMSGVPDLAYLPRSQQAPVPIQPGGTEFPGHLFW